MGRVIVISASKEVSKESRKREGLRQALGHGMGWVRRPVSRWDKAWRNLGANRCWNVMGWMRWQVGAGLAIGAWRDGGLETVAGFEVRVAFVVK